MRNTMRNVTIVVSVLITSCHVSEYANWGPVTIHVATVPTARTNAHGDPMRPQSVLRNYLKRRWAWFAPVFEVGTFNQ